MGNAAVREPFSIKNEAYGWVESIVFSVAAVVLIFTFFLRIVGVEGSSMMDTLQDGNRVILTNIKYTPKQFDIVVLTTSAVDNPIIKRVIAVGGQTVSVDYGNNTVYVDGRAISEPFIKEAMQQEGDVTFPVTVPKGKVFVMGDNRNHSYDSRYSAIGMVDVRNILGKAVLRIFPIGEFGRL